MNETPEQYAARISSYVAGKNHLRTLQQTPAKLATLLKGKHPSLLVQRPSPDKWSVAEILAHLAEGELVLGYRLRLVASAPGTPIQAFDQDLWQNNAGYLKKTPRETLAMFRTIRQMNLGFIKSLSPEKLERFGIHSERGQESIRRMMELYAGHDENHVKQIRALVLRRKSGST